MRFPEQNPSGKNVKSLVIDGWRCKILHQDGRLYMNWISLAVLNFPAWKSQFGFFVFAEYAYNAENTAYDFIKEMEL